METLETYESEIKQTITQDVVGKSKTQNNQDLQMTSSTVSSLASPVDSGVQLLDSESEVTSVMSVSGMGCDIDTIPSLDCDVGSRNENTKSNDMEKYDFNEENKKNIAILNVDPVINQKEKAHVMTSSDIDNQNITHADISNNMSSSVPNYFDRFSISTSKSSPSFTKYPEDSRHLFNKSLSDEVFEMEHPIKTNIQKPNSEPADLMNVSLNSYELLDYTMQNKLIPDGIVVDQMHVSMSEEVNENLKVALSTNKENVIVESLLENVAVESETKPVEEQIVFRRQRKKKSKSDTPKKRVSFHEDILNSTKIDDIHINHGFITHEPDVSLSFFQKGFIRKPDVVKGRYSWAAEGDAPYYEKATNERDIKSDIYVNKSRYSSTSSSSYGSSGSTSSIDEEDNSDENVVKKEPTLKMPKSSCLKKTKKKYIDTKIVQEVTNLKKKKSETNLLDTNIFGSLKNILSFSTSVPLAERGVPEGQEDITVYSSSHDLTNRRRSCSSLKNFDHLEIKPVATIQKVNPMETAKNNLKLTTSEGFYPNYPTNQTLPSNIILCDSNVYEHKGISYSYEYDKFQKSFEQQNKPKNSTIYQTILKEFNFFRKKAKAQPENEQDDFEFINDTPENNPVENEKTEEVKEPELPIKTNLSRFGSSTKMDWSDNETISDYSEINNSRHLNSPKRKIKKPNHYSVQNSLKISNSDARFDVDFDMMTSRSLQSLRPAGSKTSLINRFLRNVTMKKMLDMKIQNKIKNGSKCMSLYVKGAKADLKASNEIDAELEREILIGSEKKKIVESCDKKMLVQFRKEVFRSQLEKLLRVFPVRSAYATNGESKPLKVILTDTTLYITGLKANNCYCNHFVLPYTELNTILLGPNAQTIHFSNYDRDMQCIISTGCSIITGDLIGQIEVSMRRDTNKPKLPAVKQLNMRDMVNLRRAICKQTSIDKDEEYFFYSIVNIQDFNPDSIETTPLGPNKEGPLMFKTVDSENRWETAYFILKAGVLYMLSSASQRVPMRVFPLINGSCQGARRIYNCPRPHTFQLIIEGKSLHLAAPDEYVASDWLQALVHAASGTYNNRERTITQSCSLMMTSDHILTIREAFPCTISSLLPSKSQHQPLKGPQALSCAAIVDLTAFRLPSAEQSWCILEFACREVHECSGDWILYFSTNSELESFISTLEMLWAYNNEQGDSFPLSTIPETDPLSQRCVDIYNTLKNTWPTNTVHLQFL